MIRIILLIIALWAAFAHAQPYEFVTTTQTQTLSNKTIDSSCTVAASTSGNAATATSLQSTPSQCSAGQAPRGINALGEPQNCTAYLQSPVNLAGADVTGVLPNANTTATSANTASAIVARDSSGNFTAGTMTGTASVAATGDSATSFWSAGTVDTARLGSGTANSTTFLRGDQTWATPTSVTQYTATYDPADLGNDSSRCDDVTVTGIVTTKAVYANPGTDMVGGCIISAVYPSATNTVRVCWRNAAPSTNCNVGSSTWLFAQ